MKKLYYVDINNGEIYKENVDDERFMYEVYTTPKDVPRIQMLLNEIMDDDLRTKYLLTPLDEYAHSQNDKGPYDEKVLTLFKALYELGTEQTKRNIEQLGVLDLAN